MAMNRVQWVGLIYVKDGLAANGKLTAMHQASLPVNGFLMEVTCLIHAMYIPLKFLLAYGSHVSPLFCAGRLLGMPHTIRRLTRRLLVILQREMRFQPIQRDRLEAEPGSQVEAEPRTKFQTMLLEATLFRGSLLTRRAVSPGNVLPAPPPLGWDAVEATARELTTMFNGEWLSSEIRHCCTAACGCRSRDEAAQRAAGALTQALLARVPRALALAKWTTVQDNVQWWTLAFLCHG